MDWQPATHVCLKNNVSLLLHYHRGHPGNINTIIHKNVFLFIGLLVNGLCSIYVFSCFRVPNLGHCPHRDADRVGFSLTQDEKCLSLPANIWVCTEIWHNVPQQISG